MSAFNEKINLFLEKINVCYTILFSKKVIVIDCENDVNYTALNMTDKEVFRVSKALYEFNYDVKKNSDYVDNILKQLIEN